SIRHRAAIEAGVEVHDRRLDGNLQRTEALDSEGNSRLGLAPLKSICAQNQVAAQHFAVCGYQGGKVPAADLFLSFEQKLYVHGQSALTFEKRFNSDYRK